MGISPVTSAPVGAPPSNSNPPSIRQAFNQLTSALQSGDLSSAQAAYQTISQSPVASDPNSPLSKALSQVGDALQSGDLGKAQQAMSQLQQQMQAMRGHHHRHYSKPADPSAADPSAAAATSATSTTATPASSNLVDVTA